MPLGAALVIGLIGLAWLFSGCSEGIARSAPSPDGRYVAHYITRGCGGAAGSVTILVRLQHVEALDSEDDTILEGPSRDFSVSMSWPDARTLAIDYNLRPDYQQYVRIRPPTNDVQLLLRPTRR